MGFLWHFVKVTKYRDYFQVGGWYWHALQAPFLLFSAIRRVFDGSGIAGTVFGN